MNSFPSYDRATVFACYDTIIAFRARDSTQTHGTGLYRTPTRNAVVTMTPSVFRMNAVPFIGPP